MTPENTSLQLSKDSSLTARLFSQVCSNDKSLMDQRSVKRQKLDSNSNSAGENKNCGYGSSSYISVVCNPRQSLSSSIKAEPLSTISPTDFLESLINVHGCQSYTFHDFEESDFFIDPTDEHYSAYSTELIRAIREQDFDVLKDTLSRGKTLFACNRYGESLLHMACRRGFSDLVEFLLYEGNVPLRIRDDYGRTAMHDACWTVEPNFELIETLITEEPLLLFIKDKRGHLPLEYVRSNHWHKWNDFLKGKQVLLQSIVSAHQRTQNSAE